MHMAYIYARQGQKLWMIFPGGNKRLISGIKRLVFFRALFATIYAVVESDIFFNARHADRQLCSLIWVAHQVKLFLKMCSPPQVFSEHQINRGGLMLSKRGGNKTCRGGVLRRRRGMARSRYKFIKSSDQRHRRDFV